VEPLDHRRDLGRVDSRLDPDRGQLDDVGAEPAQRSRQAAGLGPRPGDDDAAAVQGTRLQPGDPLAPGGDRP
jgi:hypothetical protein